VIAERIWKVNEALVTALPVKGVMRAVMLSEVPAPYATVAFAESVVILKTPPVVVLLVAALLAPFWRVTETVSPVELGVN
jgi:hypothetical protein